MVGHPPRTLMLKPGRKGWKFGFKMTKKATNTNTLKTEENLSKVKDALVRGALGYETEETVAIIPKSGKPYVKKVKKDVRPDPKAAAAYAKIVAADKVPPKKNKFLQVTEDDRILVSTSKLAEIMSISVKTVGTWENAGCPKEKRGWYDVAAVIKWRGREAGVQGGPSAMADKLQADVRLKQARAAMAENELRIKSGELIPAVLVEERLSGIFSDLKNSMLAISDHLMTEMYGQFPELAPQVRRLVDGYVREALKNVAAGRGKLTDRPVTKKATGRPRKTS